jgi:hypothetical protein
VYALTYWFCELDCTNSPVFMNTASNVLAGIMQVA